MTQSTLLAILALQVLFNAGMISVIVLLLRRGGGSARRTAPASGRAASPAPPRNDPPPDHLTGLVAEAEQGELAAEAQLKRRLARFAQGTAG